MAHNTIPYEKIMCCGRKKYGGRYMPPYVADTWHHTITSHS